MDLYLLLVTVSATIFTLLGRRIFSFVYGKFRVQENRIIASSPKSTLPRNCTHDVFPSFHGADVRKSFLSYLVKEFGSKGINLFIDNEITRGEFIGPELKKAIQGSRIAIVLLSKRYASSSWCLDELVEIMKCKEDLGQMVIPVFYEVDPTDVKKFGKVFKKTCNGKTNEMLPLMLFKSTPPRDFDELIGMEAHMNKISWVLRTDLDEVRMIGIWGPAGIGKTTIARCMFNQLSHTFQHSVFMMNVKAMYTPPVCSDDHNVKLLLQQKFLSQLTNQKEEWGNALPELRMCLDGEIESILMFGYNALSHENKDLFLHIACFFHFERMEKVVEHLSKRFSDARQRLNVLAEKSLICLEIGRVIMHDLLVQLGRDIVRKQSTEPGQRQFLVDKREIGEVLADDAAGSRSVISGNEINVSERDID
ncbi:BnaCnng53000D [Brassica napus]|uniref:BnaCnng53000D protein n=1 Tax=Brassica napus TaxID=3708 RepID=A0A078JJP9_BRANA|nr:BnaCnng53000D [Brassica napus]